MILMLLIAIITQTFCYPTSITSSTSTPTSYLSIQTGNFLRYLGNIKMVTPTDLMGSS